MWTIMFKKGFPSLWILLCWVMSICIAIDLGPISGRQLDEATGLLKRQESNDRQRLHLLDYESFYWGGQGSDTTIYANLTLYFKDDFEFIIGMESFEDMLKSVTCGNPMTLEFKDQPSYTQAAAIWNWVNDDANYYFVFVASAEKCGTGTDRQPFLVRGMQLDEPSLRISLNAEPKEWTDVAKDYSFHMGYAPAVNSNSSAVARRDDTDFTMSLASKFNRNLFHQKVSGIDLSVDCSNCGTTGKLLVDFDLDVSWSGPKVSMKVSPKDVAAFLQLSMSASGTLSEAYRWEKTLVSIPIEGIKIGDWAKIGAFLDVDVGFSLDEWTGDVSTSFGAKMALSNAALVQIDVFDPDNGKFSGWNPSLTALPFSLGAKVSGSAQLYAQPSISLSATALKHGIEMSLDLRIPYIEIDFDAIVNTAGVCGTKNTIGVDLDASAGVDLSVQVAKAGNEANPLWEKTLFNQDWPLFSKCYPFGPEGSGSGSGGSGGGGGSKPKSKKPKTKMPKTKVPKKPKPTSAPAKDLKPKKTTVKHKPTSKKATGKPTSTAPPKTSKVDKDKTTKTTTHTTAKTTDSKSHSDKSVDHSKATSKATSKSTSKNTSESTSKATSESTSKDASKTTSKDTSHTSDTVSVVPSVSTKQPSHTTTTSMNTADTSKTPGSGSLATSTATTSGKTTSSKVTPSTSTSRSSTSFTSTTSSADSCPTFGCSTCDDDSELQKRGTKEVKLRCDTLEKVLRADNYPLPYEWQSASFKVTPWYRPDMIDDLDNYKMVAEPSKNTQQKCAYQTEHVYEANWIVNFMLSLTKGPHRWTCSDLNATFFSNVTAAIGKQTPSGRDTWAEEIMSRLGSNKNQHLLTMLSPGKVNSRKNNIYDSVNVIDDDNFNGKKGLEKMDTLAAVGRAMVYMSDARIGKVMKETAENIEEALLALGADIVARNPDLVAKTGGADKDKAFLGGYHRVWLRQFLIDGNERVWTRFDDWAKRTSKTLDSEPQGPKTQQYKNFLKGLTGRSQVEKVAPGFNQDNLT